MEQEEAVQETRIQRLRGLASEVGRCHAEYVKVWEKLKNFAIGLISEVYEIAGVEPSIRPEEICWKAGKMPQMILEEIEVARERMTLEGDERAEADEALEAIHTIFKLAALAARRAKIQADGNRLAARATDAFFSSATKWMAENVVCRPDDDDSIKVEIIDASDKDGILMQMMVDGKFVANGLATNSHLSEAEINFKRGRADICKELSYALRGRLSNTLGRFTVVDCKADGGNGRIWRGRILINQKDAVQVNSVWYDFSTGETGPALLDSAARNAFRRHIHEMAAERWARQ